MGEIIPTIIPTGAVNQIKAKLLLATCFIGKRVRNTSARGSIPLVYTKENSGLLRNAVSHFSFCYPIATCCAYEE